MEKLEEAFYDEMGEKLVEIQKIKGAKTISETTQEGNPKTVYLVPRINLFGNIPLFRKAVAEREQLSNGGHRVKLMSNSGSLEVVKTINDSQKTGYKATAVLRRGKVSDEVRGDIHALFEGVQPYVSQSQNTAQTVMNSLGIDYQKILSSLGNQSITDET